TCGKAKDFFGIIQCIYTTFANSTKKWQILKDNITGLTLKSVSATRWESRIDSVKAIRFQCAEIREALLQVSDIDYDVAKSSEAKVSYKASDFPGTTLDGGYGDIFKTHLLECLCVMLASPEAARFMLVSQARLFKPTYPPSKERMIHKCGRARVPVYKLAAIPQESRLEICSLVCVIEEEGGIEVPNGFL
ncbi:hypothetical protein E2562_035183, partial [Oryza meyeriana var. granulata]